ncbi:MAG TPA: hypothetical protein ENK31_08830 [Nannocystis exedens]|nr:hypothetical protein [Nannocystis exedens]
MQREIPHSKYTEAYNDDLSGWRQVKATIYYDLRASTDYRIVAVAQGDNFAVKAIHCRGKNGGKTYVAGEHITAYGRA